jgi:hypothetical protein
MKITNRTGLPPPLVAMLTKEYYSKGDSEYSATGLIEPPRIKLLRERYKDQIESDVVDMMWSFLGTALHARLEELDLEALGLTSYIKEERLFAEVNGIRISGAIDLQEKAPVGIIISDYKYTSAYSVIYGKEEWVAQLNIYKWFVEKVKGERVVALRICAFLRDHSKHDARGNYPAEPIVEIDLPVWSFEKADAYVKERLNLHLEAAMADATGGALPPCTDAERWMTEEVFAVKREGRKTAIKLYNSMEEATARAVEEKGYVETRKGTPRRCEGNYCKVAQWCDQYQSEKREEL